MVFNPVTPSTSEHGQSHPYYSGDPIDFYLINLVQQMHPVFFTKFLHTLTLFICFLNCQFLTRSLDVRVKGEGKGVGKRKLG